MEDRVWVSSEGRVSAPVLLGLISDGTLCSPDLSSLCFGHTRRREEARKGKEGVRVMVLWVCRVTGHLHFSPSHGFGLSFSHSRAISLSASLFSFGRRTTGFLSLSSSLALNSISDSLSLCFPPSRRLSLSHSVSFVSQIKESKEGMRKKEKGEERKKEEVRELQKGKESLLKRQAGRVTWRGMTHSG
jgi:hypothetical protein